jgi:uncharacterized protein (DUF1501 family)
LDTVTRRKFLIASGVTGGAALAAGSSLMTWQQLHQHAQGSSLPTGSRILVIVTLYGGNDGLNTVIPYSDAAYHDARPELAYAEGEVLRVDDSVGLNPALKGLADLWQRKQLAIVRGVGYPKPDHSHFRSMDIWQTASPQTPVNTGWIGRWLDETGGDPVRAVNIGAVLPPLAVGAKCAAAALPLGREKPLSADLTTALTGLGQHDPSDQIAPAMVASSLHDERTVATTFEAASGPSAADPDHDQVSAAGSAGGQAGLKSQLDLVARCIRAGVPTRAYAVSLGGFDTHADEKGTQQAQLGQLDVAMSSFLREMASDPRGRNVVLLAYSEFGRRVAANASQGTDHGTAGPVLVAGLPVKGGFYGEQPSLTDLDNGDLKVTTDFRAVYAEVLATVLGTDPARVLGADRPHLGILG